MKDVQTGTGGSTGITYEQAQAYARKLIFLEIKRGKLPSLADGKTQCRDCPRPAERYDHRDYSKPLEVEPVCHGCNRARGPARFEPTEWRRVKAAHPARVQGAAKTNAARAERARLKREADQAALLRFFEAESEAFYAKHGRVVKIEPM